LLTLSIRKYLSQIKSYINYFISIVILKLISLSFKKNLRLAGCFISDDLFAYLFRHFAYRGNLLTDLERYLQTGRIRARWIKRNDGWKEQSRLSPKERLRVGFLGTFGKEANFPKEFFRDLPQNVEVFVYDLNRTKKNKKYNGVPFLKGLQNVTCREIRNLKNYTDNDNNQEEWSRLINADQLDVLVFTLGEYILRILDYLTAPVIIPMNVTSLLLPHPKCRIQMYNQPPWPYEVRDSKLWNLKTKKFLSFPAVVSWEIYSRRATKGFEEVPWTSRECQIFFSGNLRKLNSGKFSQVLMRLMRDQEDLKLVYYGRENTYHLNSIRACFERNSILDRTLYKGSYTHEVNRNGEFIIDNKLLNAFNDLRKSKLFLNTFPISGARSCIEAYSLGVPVIHLSSSGEEWLKNQKNVYFRLPIILTESGTAHTIDEYISKAKRVLTDESFAKTIIKEQNQLLEKLTDTDRFWRLILDIVDKYNVENYNPSLQCGHSINEQIL